MERLERLINLVIALRATRRPMTAAEIRDRVAGYDQPDREAFRRMFERDKADLRAMGVPVETVPTDVWEDQLGYRIDPADYDLEPVNLTAAELATLAVALQATGLRPAGHTGLLKLQVAAGDPGSPPDPVPFTIDLEAPHREVLIEAQLSRRTARFAYRTVSGETATRTVDPHALVHRGGRWYLVDHDHDRNDRRAFRLDRIEDEVALVTDAGAFPDPPDPVTMEDVVPEEVVNPPRTATVRAHPEVTWQIARKAVRVEGGEPDGWGRFQVGVSDSERFVQWALSFGPELVVEAPTDLRAAVVEALRQARGTG